MTDEKSLIDWALGLLVAGLMWFAKRQVTRTDELHRALEKHKEQLKAHELHVAQTFAPRDEIAKRFDKLDEKIDRVLSCVNKQER